MKMKALRLLFGLLATTLVFVSCEDDDDQVTTIEIRDRGEQQTADSDSLIDYLSSHYYNSSFFETGTNHKYTDIVITELAEGEEVPVGHTLLIDSDNLVTLTTTFLETEYTYYILNLNQGGGDSPRFTDVVSVRYEGKSINNDNVFDIIASPQVLNLQGNLITTFGVIRAWQLVIPQFNTSTDFTIGNDGIVSYEDFGLGVMFVPSGLGYFSSTTTGAAYDNLMFKFELLRYEEEDHDGDGIPSYIEDLDANLDVSDNDTDENGLSNFIDIDDDGDGIGTFDELEQTIYTSEPVLAANEYILSRIEDVDTGEITITTVTALDTNDNGILDYLDDTVTTNYNEEEN